MNTSTKKIFVSAVAAIALFFTTSLTAQAQEPAGDSRALRLGIGVSAGIPTTTGYSFAFGVDARLQKDFTDNISGILSVGYNNFSFKDSWGGGSYDFIPVKAGAKIFVAESLYVSGELGAGFATTSGGGTSFLYAPGVGYAWNSGLDLGVRYEGASQNGGTLGQVALRVAYGFRL